MANFLAYEEDAARFHRRRRAGLQGKCARGVRSAAATAAVAAPATTAAVAPAAATDPPPFALGTKMKCAVTGEEFTVSAKTTQIVHDGKRYAFCCSDCLPEFNKNPAKYTQN